MRKALPVLLVLGLFFAFATTAGAQGGVVYLIFGGNPSLTPPDSSNQPDPGYEFYRMAVVVSNRSAVSVAVDPSAFVADVDRVLYSPSSSAAIGPALPPLQHVTLFPGGTAFGYIGFQVPVGSNGVGLYWNLPAAKDYRVQVMESKHLAELGPNASVLDFSRGLADILRIAP